MDRVITLIQLDWLSELFWSGLLTSCRRVMCQRLPQPGRLNFVEFDFFILVIWSVLEFHWKFLKSVTYIKHKNYSNILRNLYNMAVTNDSIDGMWTSNKHDRSLSPLEHVSQSDALTHCMSGLLPIQTILHLSIYRPVLILISFPSQYILYGWHNHQAATERLLQYKEFSGQWL